MTVQVQDPVVTYTANGSVDTFSFPFRIILEEDIKVYLDGVLQSSGYTVTGVDAAGGGDVIFTTAPTNGLDVRLQRLVSLDRETDYIHGGALNADTLDIDVDRIIHQIQDLDRISFKENSLGHIDAGTRRVTDVVDPVDAQDAATKNWSMTAGASFVSASSTSATNAASSETNAAASAVAAAALLIKKGALVKKDAHQTVSSNWGSLTFEAEEYDTDALHSNSVNNHHISVPSGARKVRLTANFSILATVGDGTIGLRMCKNTSNSFVGGGYAVARILDTSFMYVNIVSAIIDVVDTDIFFLQAFEDCSGSVDVRSATETWFLLEVVE